jgi:hypothetical protein
MGKSLFRGRELSIYAGYLYGCTLERYVALTTASRLGAHEAWVQLYAMVLQDIFNRAGWQ